MSNSSADTGHFIVHLLEAVFLQADDIQIKFFSQAVCLVYDDLSRQAVPLRLWQSEGGKQENKTNEASEAFALSYKHKPFRMLMDND